MPFVCTVCREATPKNEKKSFFVYPKDVIRRRMWLKAVNREDLRFALKDENRRQCLKICEKHFERKYIKSKNVQVLSDDAFPTLYLNNTSNPNVSQCQNATKEKQDIVRISMDESCINAFTIKLAENDRPEMKRLFHTDTEKMEEVIDLETNAEVIDLKINDNSVNLEKKDEKNLQSCSFPEKQPKIPTRDKVERKEVIDSEMNVNSSPTVTLKEKDVKLETYIVYEGEPNMNSFKILSLDSGETQGINQASFCTDKKEMEKVINFEEKVNLFPKENFQETNNKDIQSYNVYKDQPKFGMVNTVPDWKTTYVCIPRYIINCIQNRLKYTLRTNCKSMNIKRRRIKFLELVRQRLLRKRIAIKRSLAMLRKKYRNKNTGVKKNHYAEIGLLDIEDMEVSKKLKKSNQTETITLYEDTQTSSESPRVEIIHDPLPFKIFESHTLYDDTQPSSDTFCNEVTCLPLPLPPIKFEVFDETEEDSPPVHLMTSHMSMANSKSSMPDFLVPEDTPPMVTSVSLATNTEDCSLDEYDKFALSLAKSMKLLSNPGDTINLVLAMQNLVSEYVTRDLKSAFPNLLDPAYAARDQATNNLLRSLRKKSPPGEDTNVR